MDRGSTLFLKAVVVLLGLVVLALCIFALPPLIQAELSGDFDYGFILLGLYVPAIPYMVAIYNALQLLGLIEKQNVFSELSVGLLRNIKYCALIVGGLFSLGMPYIFYLAEMDDAPGLAAVGFIIIFTSLVIATAAGVFQKLLQNAVEIKSENDLTV